MIPQAWGFGLAKELTIQELQRVIGDYVTERDWNRYHKPKDVAISMAIESSELLELFQWKPDPMDSGKMDEKLKNCIGEEISDIIIYAVCMANSIGLDLSEALVDKIENNRQKYPADKVAKARDWEEVRAIKNRVYGDSEDD